MKIRFAAIYSWRASCSPGEAGFLPTFPSGQLNAQSVSVPKRFCVDRSLAPQIFFTSCTWSSPQSRAAEKVGTGKVSLSLLRINIGCSVSLSAGNRAQHQRQKSDHGPSRMATPLAEFKLKPRSCSLVQLPARFALLQARTDKELKLHGTNRVGRPQGLPAKRPANPINFRGDRFGSSPFAK